MARGPSSGFTVSPFHRLRFIKGVWSGTTEAGTGPCEIRFDSARRLSSIDHLGIEVESVERHGHLERTSADTRHLGSGRGEHRLLLCLQDKLWFSDSDGNAWEVFTVHELLPVEGILSNAGCCTPIEKPKVFPPVQHPRSRVS
jgi:hypothetical protein